MPDGNDDLNLVQRYREVVLRYEELDAEIDRLLEANGGHSENMSAEDLARYRALARQREEAEDEMHILEQQLLMDDDN